MKYRFHPEALEEYREATNWYAEREPELGLRFIEAVEAAVQQVVEAPARWRVIDEDVRRCVEFSLTACSTRLKTTSYSLLL